MPVSEREASKGPVRSQVEGLLLSKMPYQDRHLLGKILLRNGKKISVIFYGGQGASGVLEIGHMLQLQLQRKNALQLSDLFGCRHWQLLWYHRQIRQNYRSFTLACFYLEVVNYCALSSNFLGDDERPEETFKVCSNGIYYLDQAVSINYRWHQSVFLAKLLAANGVFPQLDSCLLDERALQSGAQHKQLRIDQGGFVWAEEGSEGGIDDRLLWDFFRLARDHSQKALLTSMAPFSVDHQKLWSYVCFHLQIENNQIKSYSSLSSSSSSSFSSSI